MSRTGISDMQREALAAMVAEPLRYDVAGWGNSLDVLKRWSVATIAALEQRELCTVRTDGFRRRVATVTAAGRERVRPTAA